MFLEDVDVPAIVKRLKEVTVHVKKEGDVPFISEAALYHLIGKESARTVLTIIDDLCKAATANQSSTP